MSTIFRTGAILIAIAWTTATAGAQTPGPAFPVTAPPTANNAAASALFDAMLAIGRAAATNPGGARLAAAPYAAAIQQYNAGDLVSARLSALQAISQTTQLPAPEPEAWRAPALTLPAVRPMPAILDPAQADAESFLALARRSLASCGASPAGLPQLQSRYAAIVGAETHGRYDLVRSGAREIIDACAVPPAPQPSPAG
jgi:hypothetical protein